MVDSSLNFLLVEKWYMTKQIQWRDGRTEEINGLTIRWEFPDLDQVDPDADLNTPADIVVRGLPAKQLVIEIVTPDDLKKDNGGIIV